MDRPMSFLDDYHVRSQEVRGSRDTYRLSLYSCPSSVLFKLSISNWQNNRPEDEKRVTEAAHEIGESARVQGIIALAHMSDKLVCYDGNHRRLALKLSGKNDVPVLLSIIWNASQESVIDEYELLNKSVSVPYIYTKKGSSKPGRLLIAEFCKRLVDSYPEFVKASRQCKPPHFNRDVLSDNISDLCERHPDLTTQEILDTVKQMNRAYRKEQHGFRRTSLSQAIDNKCASGGLWLFCRGRVIDKHYFDLVRGL